MGTRVAALIALGSIGALVVFQMALALGAPWGSAAWGGRHGGVLPARFRVASGVVAVLIYPLIALYLLDAAGVTALSWLPTAAAGTWALTGIFGLGVIANLVSPSKVERIWAAAAFVLAVCSAVIAAAM